MKKRKKRGNVSIIAPEFKFLENEINIRLPIEKTTSSVKITVAQKKMIIYSRVVSRAT